MHPLSFPGCVMDPLYTLSGFVVGGIVGLTGVGGGSLMTPLLVLLFGTFRSIADAAEDFGGLRGALRIRGTGLWLLVDSPSCYGAGEFEQRASHIRERKRKICRHKNDAGCDRHLRRSLPLSFVHPRWE